MSAAGAFSERLADGARSLGIDVTPELAAQLSVYQAQLERWSLRTNLVSDARPEATVERHFLDSLALLRLLPSQAGTITDVGSGAGFPGAVLAVARPDWPVRLVEPLQKRAGFLAAVVAALGLRNTRVLGERSDALPDGSCDAVLSRATLPPREWVREAGRLLRPGGIGVLMTAHGPTPDEAQAAQAAGLTEAARDAFELPRGCGPRVNVLYRKG